jgi:hypothetical protein
MIIKQQNIPLALVKPNWDFWGIIDISGNYVVEPIFNNIFEWKDGIARLEKSATSFDTKGSWKNSFNGQYGFVNACGKPITDFSFGYANDFSNGLAAVNKNNKWGFIDTSGQIVITFQFDDIRDFTEDGCVVLLDKRWGLIDKKGKWEFEDTFENISGFAFGLAVATKTSDTKEKFSLVIDTKGNKIVDLPKEWAWFKPVSDKLILIGTSSGYPGDRLFGFMNLKGEIITQPQFYVDSDFGFDIGEFSEEMLAVRNKEGFYGFVNEFGELSIPLQFQSVTPFNNGVAKVFLNDKTFFIDKSGKLVDYEEPENVKKSSEDILLYSEGLAVARKGDLWGVIDENNKVIVEFKYGRRLFRTVGDSGLYFSEEYPQYSCGLIGINDERSDNIYAGYLDKDGKVAIELKYRVAARFILNK